MRKDINFLRLAKLRCLRTTERRHSNPIENWERELVKEGLWSGIVVFGFCAGEMQVDRDYEGKHVSHNRINQILIELGLARTVLREKDARDRSREQGEEKPAVLG